MTNTNANINTKNLSENATKLFNKLNSSYEAKFPKKVKEPKKPKDINQAKKALENKDLVETIKALYKEKGSLTRIANILNEEIADKSFKTKTRAVAISMYEKKGISIPAGKRITQEVKDKVTGELRPTEFVEIEYKDKFTITILQNLLGVEKKSRETKAPKEVVKEVTPKAVENSKTETEIDDILDSLVAWTGDRESEEKIDWKGINKPKTTKKRTLSKAQQLQKESDEKIIKDNIKKYGLDKLPKLF